jgi:HK97 family phage portal protein
LSQDEATSVSAVWACIQVISTAIASSPWLVYEVTGRKRTYKPEDPLSWILNQQASSECSAIAFREAMLFGALATGGGFAEISRDKSGRVTGLLPLDPNALRLWRVPDSGRLLYVYQQTGGEIFLEPRDVFHLRGPVTVFGLLGDSLVGRAARSIALSAAAERFAVGYLANGAVPSMALRYPGKLDDKSFNRIREQWAERYAGPRSSGKPLILEGNMDAKDVSADPQKAQLIPTQQFSLEQVARYFGVPLVLLGVESAAQGYGVNLESMMRSFRVQTLTPWCKRLEQEANAKLLSPSPYRETTVDTSWLSRGDAKSQAEADRVRIESGVLTVNEVREEMGENTIGKEGDIRFVAAGLQPLTTTLLDIQELAAKEPEPATSPSAVAEDESPDEVEEPEGGDEETPVLRQALRQLVLQNLERMDKRLAVKFAELQRGKSKPEEIDAKMAEERKRLRAELERDCYPALALIRQTAKTQGRHLNGEADSALLAAVDAVAKGKAPAAEADKLISALLPEVEQ